MQPYYNPNNYFGNAENLFVKNGNAYISYNMVAIFPSPKFNLNGFDALRIRNDPSGWWVHQYDPKIVYQWWKELLGPLEQLGDENSCVR